MIKPDQIIIQVIGDPMGPLAKWLSLQSESGYDWETLPFQYRLDAVRNRGVRKFLTYDRDYLIQLDRDVFPWEVPDIPESGISPLLNAEGELLYCGWFVPHRPGHYGDGVFSSSCFRASSALLRDIGTDWFRFAYDEAYNCIACDCVHFMANAKIAGRESKMVAVAGHIRPMAAFPLADGKAAFIDPGVL